MPYVRACLERSKSFGLSIGVDLQDKHTWHQTLPFLDVILPHSTRWEQFQIRFGVWKVGSGFRQALLQSLSSSQLPSLELLSLYFSHFKFYKGPSLWTPVKTPMISITFINPERCQIFVAYELMNARITSLRRSSIVCLYLPPLGELRQ